MIGTKVGVKERQVGTAGGGRLFTQSEGDINSVVVQQAQLFGDALASHAEATRLLLEHLKSPKAKRIRVDEFRSTATIDSPAGTGLSVTFPQSWLPSPAVISSIVYGVGGTAAATLQIGRRIYPINVGAAIPNPGALPLGDDVGLYVLPSDLIKLSVPATPVILSLELIGFALDPSEAERVIA